jgi:hypothetical protein
MKRQYHWLINTFFHEPMKPFTYRQRTLSYAIAASIILLGACSPADNGPTTTPVTSASSAGLAVTNWGPTAAQVGVVPNKQPNGHMGLWIQVESTQGLGEVQVLVGGHIGSTAVVAEKLITSAFPVEVLAQPGALAVTVKQVATGKSFAVGTFTITQ